MKNVDCSEGHWWIGPEDRMISIPHSPEGGLLCMGGVFWLLLLHLNGFMESSQALKTSPKKTK